MFSYYAECEQSPLAVIREVDERLKAGIAGLFCMFCMHNNVCSVCIILYVPYGVDERLQAGIAGLFCHVDRSLLPHRWVSFAI